MARPVKWMGKVRKGMERRGTVGIFRRRAKALGVSTQTLARRWRRKAGVWGKRARLALTYRKYRPGARRGRARRRRR